MHLANFIITGSLLACLIATPSTAGTIYKWTDSEGQVHYGDHARHEAAEEFQIKQTAPAPDPARAARNARTERLLNSFQQDRAERRAAEQAAAAEAAERQTACESAKTQLQKYESAALLYRTDDDGHRVILGEGEYQAALEQARETVRKRCG